ncbi:MAG: IS4 family transposase, partial [Methylococcales bacterium]
LLPRIPTGGILLFDRGYPSFDLIKTLDHEYDGFYVFRCPAQSTFPAVERFVRSGQTEATLWIDPTETFLRRQPKTLRNRDAAKSLRAIRLESPDGTVSVLLTNLFNPTAFPAKSLIQLYFRRWAIESHYRDEKTFLGLESFHSRTENGIRQELYAVLIMSVIARLLMAHDSRQPAAQVSTPQFKNAVMTLASEAAFLAAEQPQIAISIFTELLDEIARVRYYAPKTPRPSCPRVCKKPINKWQRDRAEKLVSS